METKFIIFTVAILLAFGTAIAAVVLYQKKNKDERYIKPYRIVSCVAVGLIAIAAVFYVLLGNDIFK